MAEVSRTLSISLSFSLLCGAALTACLDGAPEPEPAELALPAAAAVSSASTTFAPPPPTPCPTSGTGAIIVSGASCVTFTPAMAGAAAGGVNAGTTQYGLAPTSAGTGRLVLFLPPSLGTPTQSIATPASNLYTAGIAAGDHVLSIAYRNNQVVGATCNGNDPCFLGMRMALVTGQPQPNAPAALNASILPTEGIHARAALALAYLAAVQPTAGWSQYLNAGVDPAVDPAGAVKWSRVIAVGHSQGGGHAALLAKLHLLARLVTLASPCDEVGGVPASWLDVTASWQTPALRGWGFSAPVDTTCSAYSAIWTALGYTASHRFTDAVPCAGSSAHGSPLQCTANMPRVQMLLTP